MDLREYKEMPDDGLYEKIEHRLRLRRWVRTGAVTAVVAVVAVVTTLLLPWGKGVDTVAQKTASVQAPVMAVTEGTAATAPDLTAQPATVQHEESVAQPVRRTAADVAQENSLTPSPSPIGEGSRYSLHSTPLSNRRGVGGEAGVAQEIGEAALPPMTVKRDEAPLADLIMEADEGAGTAEPATTTAKSGEETPDTPHYDNLLWAPNIIAPYAENEANREFKVQATSEVSDFRMVIYNRGGRQVFIANDINRAWDARSDGNPVPQGTYVWIARYRDSSGTLRQEKGTVTVVR